MSAIVLLMISVAMVAQASKVETIVLFATNHIAVFMVVLSGGAGARLDRLTAAKYALSAKQPTVTASGTQSTGTGSVKCVYCVPSWYACLPHYSGSCWRCC